MGRRWMACLDGPTAVYHVAMAGNDLQVPGEAAEKFSRLLAHLQSCGSLLVAFSGGVDSTLLLAAARQALGERVLAVTARFAVHPAAEIRHAVRMAERLGVRHLVCDTDQMAHADFRANSQERCYVCKNLLFERLAALAGEQGLAGIAHGANCDDLADYRPGMRAAEKWGVLSPLVDAGLGKPAVRQLARSLGLPNWNRPAGSCLATRIPYGITISEERLRRVEQAEAVLEARGFTGLRVRHHESVARIEIPPQDFGRLLTPGTREAIVADLKRIGYRHVSLDLEGYVTGSLNRHAG